MSYKVDFKEVSMVGLESSPVAETLAGLRAHEARYFWNKFKHEYITVPANEDPETFKWIEKILEERELRFPYKPLEVTSFVVDGTKFAYVFFENGLAINVMYSLEEDGKRAVGFKLAEGMEIPKEFEGKFKFARQKSALAGVIRGSYFVIKGVY
ncbi:phage tail protein [uncultured Vagococcus sp.]|uniref:phage tail protein n=1 Tax=uncultured Vagococcus sp. TaxID=189676 RepID=UPI0028D35E4C|nr:phage tail protein [uncultured Vagococcus sp.]